MTQLGKINGNADEPQFDEFPLQVFTLQDVLEGKTPCSMLDVQSLLIGQAQTHKTKYSGNEKDLIKKLQRENTALKGIVLWSDQHGAVALSTLFTGFHKDGQRKYYAEDLFVASDFRAHGVFRVLLHEVAKYTVKNGGHHLQWETMSNNQHMIDVIEHYGAVRPDVVTLDASEFLDPDYTPPAHLTGIWEQQAYQTSLITSKHQNQLDKLGIDSQITWGRGDLPFSGFITHDNDNGEPTAATAAWPRVGTFDLQDGVVLEHPMKPAIEGESEDNTIGRARSIIVSTIQALRETAAKFDRKNGTTHKIHTAKWLVNTGKNGNSTSAFKVLTEDFGLVTETLGGGDREEWVLTNGKLKERAEANIPAVMRIPREKQVGQAPTNDALTQAKENGERLTTTPSEPRRTPPLAQRPGGGAITGKTATGGPVRRPNFL